MKFVLAFNGSRGDIQPAVALGVRLRERGHTIAIAAPPNLVEFAESSGLDAYSYGLDTLELLESDLVGKDLKSANPLTRIRAINEITMRGGLQMQSELLAIGAEADAIVGGSAGQERALNVAASLAIPYVPLHYCPVRRNGSVSLFDPATKHLPRLVREPVTRASWAAVEHLLWRTGKSADDALAADLGLPPSTAPAAARIARRGTPEIQAYDPVLFGDLEKEWGAGRPLVGFIDLSKETRARIGDDSDDGELSQWLAAGPPPIYVGFGSMAVPNATELMNIIVAVCISLGHRVLVAAGWSACALESDERVHVTRSVDHDAVLPRCRAAVHHGGAGTTAASLRAGVPTVVCSIGADQPIWGARVTKVGAGATLRLTDVTPTTFDAALSRALDAACVAAAERVAAAMISPAAAADRAADIVEQACVGDR